MADPLVAEYEALLGAVAGFQPRGNGENALWLFWPFRGEDYSGGLMIVGRAGNGGGSDVWTSPTTADQAWRSQRIKNASNPEVFEGMFDSDGRPTPRWGKDGRYRPSRSAFWRVAARVTAKVLDGGRGLQQIVWSNLYKVAPYEGGNPGSRLIEKQHDRAVGVFRAELEQFQPQRVLFLTSLDWAGGFLGPNYDRNRRGDRKGPVQWSGTLAFEGLDVPPFAVVAPHPQGFPGGEDRLVEAIVSEFAP